MKKLAKITAVAALAIVLGATGVNNARAGGWPVAAGVVGGFAAGTVVATALACQAPSPAYYVYPPPVYVPAPVVVRPAPVYCVPGPVVYPYYYPRVRLAPLWGRPSHYYFRR